MGNSELFQNRLPLIAILRGIKTEEAIQYVRKLIELGYYFIEVPLNSPNALETIRLLQHEFKSQCLIGAGTVTHLDELKKVLETGARLIVTPNVNTDVIRLAKQSDCLIFVGVMTPSEAYTAIHCGAECLKIYPAEIIGSKGLKAINAILPKHIHCFPVGGINPDAEQLKQYLAAGARGFGIGSSLYSAGMSLTELENRAIAFKNSYESAVKI